MLPHPADLKNEWADLLDGWSAAAPVFSPLVSVTPPLSAAESSFVWPSSPDVAKFQTEHAVLRPPNLCLRNDLRGNVPGSVWAPTNAADLQLRLCAFAHSSAAGHCDRDATERVLHPKLSGTLRVQIFPSSYGLAFNA